MGVRGEIYSTKVIFPNRTYFFNVKENRMGDLYLNIVESKNRETGGFDRQSVILFAEDLQEFLKGFDESLKVLEKAVREKRRAGSDSPRRGAAGRNATDRDAARRAEKPADGERIQKRPGRQGEGKGRPASGGRRAVVRKRERKED